MRLLRKLFTRPKLMLAGVFVTLLVVGGLMAIQSMRTYPDQTVAREFDARGAKTVASSPQSARQSAAAEKGKTLFVLLRREDNQAVAAFRQTLQEHRGAAARPCGDRSQCGRSGRKAVGGSIRSATCSTTDDHGVRSERCNYRNFRSESHRRPTRQRFCWPQNGGYPAHSSGRQAGASVRSACKWQPHPTGSE